MEIKYTIRQKVFGIVGVFVVALIAISVSGKIEIGAMDESSNAMAERYDQLGIIKDFRQIETEVVLTAMDIIIDKQEGVDPQRKEGMVENFKRLKVMTSDLKALADNEIEKEETAKIAAQVEALEQTLTKELIYAVESGASQSVFDGLDNKIDSAGDELSSILKKIEESVSKELAESKAQSHETAAASEISIIMAGLIISALGIFFGSLLVRSINSTLHELRNVAEDLAHGEGDLTRRIGIRGKGEIAAVSIAIDQFLSQVHDLVARGKESSNENAAVAEELSRTFEIITKESEREAQVVAQTAESSHEIRSVIRNSLSQLESSKREILGANVMLDEAKVQVLNLTQTIQESSDREQELASKLNSLSSNADQVKEILTVISDIADQTNLLALNAAIEAARAGEHGRGFAVVADEVRKLAERTQKSLAEIHATINVLIQAINDSAQEMNENSDHIHELTRTADDVEEKIIHVASVIGGVVETTESSYAASMQIDNSVNAILDRISEIKEIAAKNAYSMDETLHAFERVNQVTAELNRGLDQFQT